jgi:hypothetical protein
MHVRRIHVSKDRFFSFDSMVKLGISSRGVGVSLVTKRFFKKVVQNILDRQAYKRQLADCEAIFNAVEKDQIMINQFMSDALDAWFSNNK